MKRKELEGKDLAPTAKDNRPSQSLKRFREMVAYTKKLKEKTASNNVTKEAEKKKNKTKKNALGVAGRWEGESFAAYTRRINRAKRKALAESDKLASQARAALLSETQAKGKKRQRLEKHKERLAAKKKKRKSKKKALANDDDDDDDQGRASSSIGDSKGKDNNNNPKKKTRKLKNRTNVTEAAPAFGEVAYRPPEFAARPKVKVAPLASMLSSESLERAEGDDSDKDDQEAAQARMLDLMRARAQLAYKNAKAKRRAGGNNRLAATTMMDRVRLLL